MANNDDGQDPALIFPGPLALVAGPGSGKTTRLARRVKYLVEDEGANPDEITIIDHACQPSPEGSGGDRSIASNRVVSATAASLAGAVLQKWTKTSQAALGAAGLRATKRRWASGNPLTRYFNWYWGRDSVANTHFFESRYRFKSGAGFGQDPPIRQAA